MAARGKNIPVILEGRGSLTLREGDYKTTGGEGSIYKAHNTIVKLYTDPDKMRRDNMPAKIKALSAIKHPYIVAPDGLVLEDRSKEPIGFYMPFVDGEAMPSIFTNSFRQRSGFGDEDAKRLVERMRETMQFAHQNNALMIDPNELNWLVILNSLRHDPEPRAIDVDSWVIGKLPPKVVVMPSVRDWHAKQFGQQTDWFSWGVVTFQILVGIHPYKGALNGYKPLEMDRRMQDNASVFAPGVGLSNAVRDFSCIPGPLLTWYRNTFQQGERTIPPSVFAAGVTVAAPIRTARATVTASGVLIFEKLYEKQGDAVTRIWTCGVCMLQSGALYDLDRKRTIGSTKIQDCEIVKVDGGWLVAGLDNKKVECFFINDVNYTETKLHLSADAFKVVRYENRMFAVTDRGLTELILMNFGKPVISFGNTWGAMLNSTTWFDGVGVQDALGAMFLVVPFGDKSCTQVRVRELDTLTPVAAKSGNRYVVVVAVDKTGDYKQFEFVFSKDYTSYQVTQTVVDSADLNMALLPRGVCARIVDDGVLDIFVPTSSSGSTNRINDKFISADMMLANWNDTVVYIHKGVVWKMQMKSK
jgi:hypothetical protein